MTWAKVVPLLLWAACAQPQWTLSIGTNASPPDFGDRLLVQVFDKNGNLCDTCSREIALSASGPGAGPAIEWPLSLGIAPGPSDDLMVRATLYSATLASFAGPGGPDGLFATAYIDARGRLPQLSGVTRVGLSLSLDCFGVISTDTQTCDPKTGQLGPIPVLPESDGTDLPLPGTWPPLARVRCPVEELSSDEQQQMVCVDGGTFIMGGPQAYAIGLFLQSMPQHLIQVAPFAIDKEEFSVGQIKSLINAGKLTGTPHGPKTDTPLDYAQYGECTYVTGDSSMDGYPANCLTQALASAACQARDPALSLPTEAEWEYAAGNQAQKTTYPWGNDGGSVCTNAWVARGRLDLDINEDSDCASQDQGEQGPGELGMETGDVTALGIRHMAGNVSEWLEGCLIPYTDPCWNAPLLSPCPQTCPVNSKSGLARGGNWYSWLGSAIVVQRNIGNPGAQDAGYGFRCVRRFGANPP